MLARPLTTKCLKNSWPSFFFFFFFGMPFQYFYSGLVLWIKYCVTFDPAVVSTIFFSLPYRFSSPLFSFHCRERWQVQHFHWLTTLVRPTLKTSIQYCVNDKEPRMPFHISKPIPRFSEMFTIKFQISPTSEYSTNLGNIYDRPKISIHAHQLFSIHMHYLQKLLISCIWMDVFFFSCVCKKKTAPLVPKNVASFCNISHLSPVSESLLADKFDEYGYTFIAPR